MDQMDQMGDIGGMARPLPAATDGPGGADGAGTRSREDRIRNAAYALAARLRPRHAGNAMR